MHNNIEFKGLTKESVRAIVREAVAETLDGLGFETTKPKELQADMYFLRRLRYGQDEVWKLIRRSVMGLAISATLYLLWDGLMMEIWRQK